MDVLLPQLVQTFRRTSRGQCYLATSPLHTVGTPKIALGAHWWKGRVPTCAEHNLVPGGVHLGVAQSRGFLNRCEIREEDDSIFKRNIRAETSLTQRIECQPAD